jgi:hypothetical protein
MGGSRHKIVLYRRKIVAASLSLSGRFRHHLHALKGFAIIPTELFWIAGAFPSSQ